MDWVYAGRVLRLGGPWACGSFRAVMQLAAIIAALILVLVVIVQTLLAAGAALGHLAWGGQNRILPANHRRGSAIAALILGFAAWVISARAGLIVGGLGPGTSRAVCWIFAVMFASNTLGNMASRSRAERLVMTPITLALVVCFAIAAAAQP